MRSIIDIDQVGYVQVGLFQLLGKMVFLQNHDIKGIGT